MIETLFNISSSPLHPICFLTALEHYKELRMCITPRFGRLNWQKVFGKSRAMLPVKLEIGAGSGEWAVAQAPYCCNMFFNIIFVYVNQ